MDLVMPRAGLLVREVDGETVILDRASERIHTLNSTAGLVWQALEKRDPLPHIVECLMERYEIDADRAAADVTSVICSFRELGLVQEA